MSVIEVVQMFLQTYDGMSMRPISEVLTDEVDLYPNSYALTSVGNSLTESDCLGNETYQNSYVFYAKSASANEIDRKENHAFLENFTNWIEGKNRKREYPHIGDNCEIKSISVSNAMLFGVDSEGETLYQVQIQLHYERKSELWL